MPNYKQDPNDSSKQVPGALPKNFFQRSVQPIPCTIAKTPNYVFINTALNDPFGFFYGTSASFADLGGADGAAGGAGKSLSGNYEVFAAAVGTVGTKFESHPCAWSGSVRDANAVTFVYTGGLDGSGRP